MTFVVLGIDLGRNSCSLVGMDGAGSVFTACGYEVRLMSPECLRPCVEAQKNDDRDAETIAMNGRSRPL